jgi:hypothetical protein
VDVAKAARVSAERVWALVLLASLVAIALALAPVAPPAGDPSPPLRPLFRDALSVDAIAAVARVDGEPSATRVRATRNGGWEERARRQLRLLLNARLERVVDAQASAPERYGLAPPALVAHVYGPTPESLVLELRVGALAPDGLSYYVEARPGPGIAKLPAYQIENLADLIDAPGALP